MARVLIVDDSPTETYKMSTILNQNGFDVITAETGEDGVKEANFGVITAARGDASNEIYAFVLGTSADSCKSILQEYGVQKIVELAAASADPAPNPDLQAAVPACET